MKKKLLFLAVVAMATAVKAQVFNPNGATFEPKRPHAFTGMTSFSPQQRVSEFEITDEHALLGTYFSDKYVTNEDDGFGFPDTANGWVAPAVFLTQDWYEDLKGKDIVAVRFAVTQDIDSCGALVLDLIPATGGNYNMKTIGYKADEGAKAGWNYIVFDEKVTIPTAQNHALLIGYEYYQLHDLTADMAAYDIICYPMSVLNFGSSRNDFYFYAAMHDWDTDTDDEGWFRSSTSGDLSVQAIVDTTGDETAINAAENVGTIYVKERYSVDGRRLSCPEKGINILHLSDGTVLKTVEK